MASAIIGDIVVVINSCRWNTGDTELKYFNSTSTGICYYGFEPLRDPDAKPSIPAKHAFPTPTMRFLSRVLVSQETGFMIQ